jgi:hypothetical protein
MIKRKTSDFDFDFVENEVIQLTSRLRKMSEAKFDLATMNKLHGAEFKHSQGIFLKKFQIHFLK